MKPDFSKDTIDTLARRAGFICSNPDCQKSTVGPNSEPSKSLVIGEAAHIRGARLKSKRYDPNMTDHARAEITNGIWLCRNCHKLVDSDEQRFPSALLFKWREIHEQAVSQNIGKRSMALRAEIENEAYSRFNQMPDVIKRIVWDKPEAWEWRLTAELFSHFNSPIFKRYDALRTGLYTERNDTVRPNEVFDWARDKITEMSVMIEPLERLLNKLRDDWGQRGEDGDADAILDSCEMIRDALSRILDFEESVYFTQLPDQNYKIKELFSDALGSQMIQFRGLPEKINEAVALNESDHGGTEENPTIINAKITFELPNDWDRKVRRELKRVNPNYKGYESFSETMSGLFFLLVFGFVIYAIFF